MSSVEVAIRVQAEAAEGGIPPGYLSYARGAIRPRQWVDPVGLGPRVLGRAGGDDVESRGEHRALSGSRK